MRLDKPRVAPLADAQLDPELRARFGSGPILNIVRTLANHPALAKRWRVFGNHILAKNTLPAREREILILRIGWLCRSGYEWGQHVVIGKASGLSDEEITRISQGPDAPGWSVTSFLKTPHARRSWCWSRLLSMPSAMARGLANVWNRSPRKRSRLVSYSVASVFSVE